MVCRFREVGPFSFLDKLTSEIPPYIYIYIYIYIIYIYMSIYGDGSTFKGPLEAAISSHALHGAKKGAPPL